MDGNDGPWPTFNIHIGTPSQNIRVLVSTAAKLLGLPIGSPTDSCVSEIHGGVFKNPTSSAWEFDDFDGLFHSK